MHRTICKSAVLGVLAGTLAVGLLAGCSGSSDDAATTSPKGDNYYNGPMQSKSARSGGKAGALSGGDGSGSAAAPGGTAPAAATAGGAAPAAAGGGNKAP